MSETCTIVRQNAFRVLEPRTIVLHEYLLASLPADSQPEADRVPVPVVKVGSRTLEQCCLYERASCSELMDYHAIMPGHLYTRTPCTPWRR